MLIDTHSHVNMMVKKSFDQLLTQQEIIDAKYIINAAGQEGVTTLINVGTSLIESINCVDLARQYDVCFAAIGIHPNDCTPAWQADLEDMKSRWFKDHQYKQEKIIGIGEIGLDKHYPDYDLPRQIDAFKAQIELALKYTLPIIVHTRDAAQETLQVLHEYKETNLRGIIHCFSEDLEFAQKVIDLGFVLGIGGTITYPKNEMLRTVVKTVPLSKIVLETDAPFLPPQSMRGKQNSPANIRLIAQYVADLRGETIEQVAQVTTATVKELFTI